MALFSGSFHTQNVTGGRRSPYTLQLRHVKYGIEMPKQAHISGQIANRGEMAGILGISVTTLDRYVAAGCPVVEKGAGRREYRFNTAEVIRWYLAN
jgi:hypothetical protein